MKILAIETSCDETSAAVIEKNDTDQTVKVVSNVVASSMLLHSQTGGIIPEVAAREQSKYIIPVIQEALEKAHISFDKNSSPEIDAIAVTYGPGLIGSLLVGVETAKTLSAIWNKPLIPVNHLFGHIYANFIATSNAQIPQFPLLALIVSGGHTDLLLMKSHTDITWLGGTRDDAAGECFDKTGRLLGLPYPAGPVIEQKAALGDAKTYHFPRPLLHDKAYDFSFSGLKTAVLREVQSIKGEGLRGKGEEKTLPLTLYAFPLEDICRGLQDAIIDVLTTKTLLAAEEYGVQSVLLSGGVAANQTLRSAFEEKLTNTGINLFVPPKNLCTDNAAMIGAAAMFRTTTQPIDEVAANPELYFD